MFGALQPTPLPAATTTYFPFLIILLLGGVAASALINNNSKPQRITREQEERKQEKLVLQQYQPKTKVESIPPVVTEINLMCHQEEGNLNSNIPSPTYTPSLSQHVQDIHRKDTNDNEDEKRDALNKFSNDIIIVEHHTNKNKNSNVTVENKNIKISNGNDILMICKGDVVNGETTTDSDNTTMNGNDKVPTIVKNDKDTVNWEPNNITADYKKEITKNCIEPSEESVKEATNKPANELLIEAVKKPAREPIQELVNEAVKEAVKENLTEPVRVKQKKILEEQNIQTSTEEEVEEPEYIPQIKMFKITKMPNISTANIVQYGPENLLEVLQVVQFQVRKLNFYC